MTKFIRDRWTGKLVAATVWLRGHSNSEVSLTLEAFDDAFYATLIAGNQVLGESGWRKDANEAIGIALLETRDQLVKLKRAVSRVAAKISSAQAEKLLARARREAKANEIKRAAWFKRQRAADKRAHRQRRRG